MRPQPRPQCVRCRWVSRPDYGIDRKLSPEEAAKYRKIREEVELEKPELIAKAQQARNEARRQQLAAVMQKLKPPAKPKD